MTHMFVVEMVGTLADAGRLTDDEITDLIEAVIDELHLMSTDPSVGATRRDADVEITVSVTAGGRDELDALDAGVTVIKAAFHAAGIGTSSLLTTTDLRSRVTALQAV